MDEKEEEIMRAFIKRKASEFDGFKQQWLYEHPESAAVQEPPVEEQPKKRRRKAPVTEDESASEEEGEE